MTTTHDTPPDEITQLDDSSWRMWAVHHTEMDAFAHIGDRRYTCAYINRQDRADVQPVRVTIDPDGVYWGYLENDDTAAPSMIWAERGAFKIQFPGDPDEYAAKNDARVVRLRIDAFTA